MATEIECLDDEVLAIAREVLGRRGSAGIIKMTTARADVRGFLKEYRQFVAECERILARNGITITSAALQLVRLAWSSVLFECSGPLPSQLDRRPRYAGVSR